MVKNNEREQSELPVVHINLSPELNESIPPAKCSLCDTPMQRVLTTLESRGKTRKVIASSVPTDHCEPCDLELIPTQISIGFLTAALTKFRSPKEDLIRLQLGQELSAARSHLLRSSSRG